MKKIDLTTTKTRLEEVTERRDEIRQRILKEVPCTKFLTKSKHGGYICLICGSGTGPNQSGAVKYYPATNTCACFANCADGKEKGHRYDPLDLIQAKYNCDYNGALQIGAQELGIDLDEYTKGTELKNKPKSAGLQGAETVLNAAGDKIPTDDTKGAKTPEKTPDFTAYFEICAKRLSDPAALSYLSARGISPETAQACNLGFDPEADPASAPGATGNEYRPHPCPRLIIPAGKSFYIGRRTDGGRDFAKMMPDGGKPDIFNMKAIYTRPGPVFIHEGAIDALSTIEAGGNAIALNSTNYAGVFLEKLQAMQATLKQAGHNMPTFIISLDNDTAGQKAAAEIGAGLDAMGIKHITANISGSHKDPNDALLADKHAFLDAIMAAEISADTAPEPGQIPPETEGSAPEEPAAPEDSEQEPAPDYMTAFLEKIQTEAYKPYKTELSFFDDLLNGGVIRQTLLLLLAAPGTGKTTLCAQIAEQMAAHGKPVIYFNLEMSREQMIAKAISGRLSRKGTQLTALEVMQGYNWTEEQKTAVIEAINEYREQIQPYLAYNPDGIGADLDAIREYLRKTGEAAKNAGTEAPVIILDYLHLISSKGGLDTQELIKQAVTMLKQYAIDYNTFVIGIVATNRTSNTAGKITMESGRDSSNLEYTADYQLSLNYYDIDNGTVSPTDINKISELQREKWRKMIIRVLKGRFCTPGRSANVYFNAANNIFYGANDWLPADPDRVPFKDDAPEEQPEAVKTIRY